MNSEQRKKLGLQLSQLEKFCKRYGLDIETVQPQGELIEPTPSIIFLEKFSLKEVLDYVPYDFKGLNIPYVPKERMYGKFVVNLYTTKMRLYKHRGITCKGCGLRASFFSLYIRKGQEHTPIAYLRLIGIQDEKYVSFTKDHIIPLSRGGENNYNNLQVMCKTCNKKKGSFIEWGSMKY